MNVKLTNDIKDKALELGFCAVGIAPAEPLEAAEQAIRELIESGMLKDYGFPRKPPHHFTRPDRLLPGARSIIAVAWPYFTNDPPSRIARFARGQDYHTAVEERLRLLAILIQGSNYRICVDTGSMIDRAAARLAGIGSYGKNACIFTREAGSWVTLGEIITDAELDYDDPAPMEECGDCSMCIKFCPTGAIKAPFIIDQTRCISHLTQMKGSIPLDLRPMMGDWIYGCDVCQEVCPKNSVVRPVKNTPIVSHNISLVDLLNITEQDFIQQFGQTAIAWIGRNRLRRNAAVALGNTGDKSAIKELEKALSDPEPMICEHAEWAIEQINDA